MFVQIFNLFLAIVGYLALAAILIAVGLASGKSLIRWGRKTKFHNKVFVGLSLLICAAGVSIIVPPAKEASQLVDAYATVPSSDTALIIAGAVVVVWAFFMLFEFLLIFGRSTPD
jgi:hypothetical protein